MKTIVTAWTRIEVQTDDGRHITMLEFDEDGIRGTSGQWYIELGSGERVRIEPTQLLQQVYDIGRLALTEPGKATT